MQRCLTLCVVLLGLLLAGCEKKTPTVDRSQPSLTANDFAARYKLRELTPDARGAYGFESGGRLLYFYPNLNVATYGGQILSLPSAPWLEDDGLHIPTVVLKQLPQDFLQSTQRPAGRMAVILDAGHGGKDDGCSGGGLKEKDITLDVVRRVRVELAKRNVSVLLTRDSDVYLTLDERSRIANNNPGAAFLSVHVNANNNASASGIETFYIADRVSDTFRGKKAADQYELNGPQGKLSGSREVQAAMNLSSRFRKESEALAGLVQQELVAASGQGSRGVKQENFAVLRENFFGAAALTEVGFISNPETRRQLASPAYRQRLAEAIARGILRYMNGGR